MNDDVAELTMMLSRMARDSLSRRESVADWLKRLEELKRVIDDTIKQDARRG